MVLICMCVVGKKKLWTLLLNEFVTRFMLLGTILKIILKHHHRHRIMGGTSHDFTFWYFSVWLGLCLVWGNPCRNQHNSSETNIQWQFLEVTDPDPDHLDLISFKGCVLKPCKSMVFPTLYPSLYFLSNSSTWVCFKKPELLEQNRKLLKGLCH